MKLVQKASLASALVSGLLLASTGLVAAQHGAPDQELQPPAPATTTAATTQEDSGGDSSTGTTQNNVRQPEGRHNAGQQHSQGQSSDQAKEKRTETREKVCENHKQGLNNRFTNAQTAGQRVKARIDDIYAKAVAYHDDKQVNVSNWADLTKAADQAKAAAATSVAALSDTPTVDCTNPNVKTDLQAYRDKIRTAHDDLKAYRTAVREILKALQTATETSQSEPAKPEGSNQ